MQRDGEVRLHTHTPGYLAKRIQEDRQGYSESIKRKQREDLWGKGREEPLGPRWNGIGFYIGKRQETFDAGTFAIMKGIHFLASGQQNGQFYGFAGHHAEDPSDAPGPGQNRASKTIELASKIYKQGSHRQ